nr:phosphoinositide 3-kinase adapter protein 1-like isoform X1 [Pocillopora verrucosa]XP_058959133.1 phosphoinositide 3-kinase adapter protein 1-like isoform X1 [Pocillopora verrucosa]
MHSQDLGNDEALVNDPLIVKAIIPPRVQNDVKEEIVIVFNKRLPSKSRSPFSVDFVGTAGAVQVSAKQLNSSTLILETPEYPVASVVTAYVYHGINRRLLGQHTFEFLSRSDTFYRLLYTELDPVKFMCESLSLSSTDVLSLDCALADTFTSNAPEGFNLLGIHKNTEAGESTAEHPTLLHFAAQFGLSRLIATLLHYPGAQEACAIKNYHGKWPYNIAEDHGFKQLADSLRTFRDQGDPNQIYADMGDEDGYYVKMQKDDGSYNYVPMGREGHGLYMYMKGRKYINLDKQEDEAGYYVKMRNSDGSYNYVPVKGEESHSGKLYEDVNEKGKYKVTQRYTESEENEEEDATYANYQAEVGADEELYEAMEGNPEGEETQDDFYMDMERERGEEDPSEFYTSMESVVEQPEVPPGYVTPKSNLPVHPDPGFYRSASMAAAIRAKEIEHERKTQTLPPIRGKMSQEDLLRRTLKQSGVYSSEAIEDMVSRMHVSSSYSAAPILRTGSTSSRSSISTISSTGSGSSSSSGISSGNEFIHHQEDPKDVCLLQEEEIHLTREELFQKCNIKPHKSKSHDDDTQTGGAPPPLPRPDYDKKEKITESSARRPHPRSRPGTTPVDKRDLEGLIKPGPPPPVKRRSSEPVTSVLDLHSKYDRAPARIPEEDPPPPPPAPRGPVPSPDDLRQPRAAPRRPVGSIALPGFPDTPPPQIQPRVPPRVPPK